MLKFNYLRNEGQILSKSNIHTRFSDFELLLH